MAREGLRYQTFSRRAILLAGGQGLLLSALGGRLYYLSVIQGESYRLRAEKNRISLRLIAPDRGEILDRLGRKLATNRQDFRVFIVPEEAEDVSGVLNRLGQVVHLSDRQMRRVKQQISRQRKFVPVTVAQRLDWETFSRINVLSPDMPGVIPDSGMTRHYPDGSDLAHVVGYVGSPSQADMDRDPILELPGVKVGREGLEKRFEDELRGASGTRRVEVNAVGREIREIKPRQEAHNGQDLHLSIDLDIQKYASKRLGEEAASAVVMNSRTGEILALASAPAYDPNDFNLGMSRENWNGLLNDPRKPLINKCLSGQYPPASTAKMVVALAALEKGIITSKTKYRCTGSHDFGDRTYNCWYKKGHGNLNLENAISKSCDVYFYKLAEQLDIDYLAEVAERFGLGQSFDVGLFGQQSGLVPTREWKKKARNSKWQRGETLNVSIGQGAMLATPLQLAIMTSRIATGRAIRPTLISKLGNETPTAIDAFPTLDVNPLHLRLMQQGMRSVMEPGGTAFGSRSKLKIKTAGKTGTAQVRRISQAERESQEGVIKNDKLPWHERDHAIFVGYGPYEDPDITVAVLVEHGGGGSSVAAPIGRDLIDKALATLNKSKTADAKQENKGQV